MPKLVLVLCLLLLWLAGHATAWDDLQTVMRYQAQPPTAEQAAEVLAPSEFGVERQLKLIVYGALAVYQGFISSQNEPTCMFEPSCSAFTKEAFTRHGLLGIIMGSDRIQRCNGLGWGYYDPADLRRGLIYDPVERYRF